MTDIKTAEELNALKEELEALNAKLEQLSGGTRTYLIFYCDNPDCPVSHGEKVGYEKTHCTLCGSSGHVE